MKTKTLKSVIAALVVLFSLNAHAYDVKVDGIYYNLDADAKQATVKSGDTKYTGEVVIPESIEVNGIQYSVTAIGDYAFQRCKNLTSVIIGNRVASIGENAFEGCSNLTSVIIPNSVTSIIGGAFNNTPLYSNQDNGLVYMGNVLYSYKGTMPENTEIIIKEGTVSISSSAFYDCSGLTSVSIPNSVMYIDNYAFYGCSGLTSVSIPNSVTSIGDYAFYGCKGLNSVNIPNSVTSIGDDAFAGCSGLTSVSIPNSVTSIGNSAFAGCSDLTSVNIPNSVTSIGSSAFSYCSGLISVTIPNSVTSIGMMAFYECGNMVSVTIGNGVTSIGRHAFRFCNNLSYVNISDLTAWCNIEFEMKDESVNEATSNPLYYAHHLYLNGKEIKQLIIPEGVTSIKGAFYTCLGLTSVSIPNSVTSISNNAFYNCSQLKTIHIKDLAAWCNISFKGYGSNPSCNNATLYLNGEEVKDLVVPNSVTSIGNYAFQGCSGLTSVTIPNGVTSIGENAFEGCLDLTSVSIPNSVTSIGKSAFRFCYTLRSVTIPNNLTSINESTFYDCSGLTSVTIPNSVTLIGKQAFYDCRRLTDIYSYAENVPLTVQNAFDSTIKENVTLHVPAASVESYMSMSPWSGFGSIVALTDEEDEICTVNGVDYIIKSANLIPNGTFDEDFAYWTGANDYATTIISSYFNIRTEEGHGNYLVGTANAGQNSAGSLGTAWEIEPNKTYYFAYDTKYLSNTEGEALYLKSSLTNTKGVETEELGLPTLKPNEWTTFEKVFTNSEEYAYCQVKFRWLDGMIGFDNFKLYEVELRTSELDAAKKEALATLDELPVGEGLLQYSVADINNAKAAVEAAKTVAAVKAVGTPTPHLPKAETAYILSLKTEDEGSPYELATSTEDIQIVATGQGTPVHLTPLEDGTWSISSNSLYLTYAGTNRWSLAMSDVAFGWIFRLVEGGYSIMGVYNGNNGYMGTNKTDGNVTGASCYGNMSWSDGNVVWTITESAEPSNSISAPKDIKNEGKHQIYSLDGTPANTPQKGVNIIRMENGKTKKVYVR